MRNKYHYLLLMICLVLPLVALTGATENQYHLVWADNFNGNRLDTAVWRVIKGNGRQYGENGYGNGELEYYTGRPENIDVKDGHLVITARKKPYRDEPYTSARIRTKNSYSWKYGKFEARIKLPYGHGMWPAFWMLPVSNRTGLGCRLSHTPEIDIMEMIGRNPSTDYGTAHWYVNGHHMKGGKYRLKKGNLADGYHTYAVIWSPDRIQWLLDGNPFFEVNRDSLKPYKWPYNKKFTLILNLAVGGIWPHNPDSTTQFPQHMYVDYVRVYRK